MQEILKNSNSWQLWLVCSITVIDEIVQATLFVRLPKKEAKHLGFPQKKLNTAIYNGMVVAIGPALAGIVVMISLMALIGSPITWQRLSVIGSAQSEMMVADISANVMGVTLGGENYTISALTMCFFMLAFAGSGWLIMATLFTRSMEKVRIKLSGGDGVWLGLLSAGATVGLISYLGAQRVVSGTGPATALVVGFAVQFVIDRFVAPRWNQIKGYSMAISLVIGMIVAYLVQPV